MLCISAYRQFAPIVQPFSPPTDIHSWISTPEQTILFPQGSPHYQINLNAPATVAAGDPITVNISIQMSERAGQEIEPLPEKALLFLTTTYGTTQLEAPLQAGQARFPLHPPLNEIAGRTRLEARVGQVRKSATMEIMPGPPVEPILLLVGPRSITADAEHWTMVTALPEDRYGNAVAAQTEVTVRTAHPVPEVTAGQSNAAIETLRVFTDDLLAWARVYSRTKAGYMYIAANAGDVHSPERAVLAVPGTPTSFGLHVEPVQLTADGRRLITIYTDPITDAAQNVLLDGTLVTFLVMTSNLTADNRAGDDTDGTLRRATAQIVEGRATVQFQAPAEPLSWTVTAMVLDQTSTPLTLTFDAGIGLTPIDIAITPQDSSLAEIESYQITAGPLLGSLGQYIPDGSRVTITIHDADSGVQLYQDDALSTAGFATIELRAATLPPGRYMISATAGVGSGSRTVEIPWGQ